MSLTESLEDSLDAGVQIKDMKYSPFQSFASTDITITKYFEDSTVSYNIQNAILTLDILTIFRTRNLDATLDIGEVKVQKTPPQQKELFSLPYRKREVPPSFIKIDGNTLVKIKFFSDKISFEDHTTVLPTKSINNLSGNLEFSLSAPKDLIGSVNFKYHNKPVSLSLNKISNNKGVYGLNMRSNTLDLDSKILVDKNILTFTDTKGSYKPIGISFDLSGNAMDFMSEKRYFNIDGLLSASNLDTTFLDSKYKNLISMLTINGEMSSEIHLSMKQPGLRTCSLESKLTIKDIAFNKTRIEELTTDLCIENTAIELPNITITMYDGIIRGTLGLTIPEGSGPYINKSKFKIVGINLHDLLKDIGPDTDKQVTGTINGDIAFKYNSGSLSSDMTDIGNYTGHGMFLIQDLKFNKININDLSGSFSIEDGIFHAPEITGKPYGGDLSLNLIVGLKNKVYPYNLSLYLNQASLTEIIYDLSGKAKNYYGMLNSDLNIKGNMKDISSIRGTGNILIVDANLGPMPILAPLIGDLYSAFQTIFTPKEIILLDSGEAYFKIMDRNIIADNIALWGKDVYITAEGTLDFDGNLDFYFQNQFRDTSAPENENWQNLIKTSIVSFGKSISKAHLKGTLKKPEWEFQYKVKDIIGDNLRKFINGISE